MEKDKNQKNDIAKKEEEILKFWKDNKIYEKAKNNNKGKKKFYFLDGVCDDQSSLTSGSRGDG